MMDLAYYLRGYNLTSTAKLIYGVLDGLSRASASKGLLYTFISRKSIAERVDVSERTARRAINQLKEAGLITVKRMGRGLNDRIFVHAPNIPKEERDRKTRTDNDRPRADKMDAPIINTKSTNTFIDVSINPQNEPVKGYTAPKGKETKKRPRRNYHDRQMLKAKYRKMMMESLNFDRLECDMFIPNEEIEAIRNAINIIAEVASNKQNISINGALITSRQWFEIVKKLSMGALRTIIHKSADYTNVRNPRAYFLACLYNGANENILSQPWYAPLKEQMNRIIYDTEKGYVLQG